MVKVAYVISLGHSGSTLLDIILGTHPKIISSGERRYLNWQLTRTLDRVGGVQEEDVCSCGADFRDCSFWSNVFLGLRVGLEWIRVAVECEGNPVRYKGSQRATHDESGKNRMTSREISILESAIRTL